MKIGIVTFHWGTNYGAILQAWCLQYYLVSQGHEVDIINYKPSQFDFSWLRVLRHPRSWKTLDRQLRNRKKETLLKPFRDKYLNMTRRFSSVNEIGDEIDNYDVLISGSDQILNPGFTMTGDNGRPTPVYWLGIGRKNIKKIGYAVSFGHERYPDYAMSIGCDWVNNFDAVGTRESTGLNVLHQLGYRGLSLVTPDPTFLVCTKMFKELGISLPERHGDYTCVYMLRHEIDIGKDAVYIDENHNPLSMEEWLSTIVNAECLITNSYHGMIVALLSHVPFVVILENGAGSGMNDRFYTLFEHLSIRNRVVNGLDEALQVITQPINFDMIDIKIDSFKDIGVNFLREQLCYKL